MDSKINHLHVFTDGSVSAQSKVGYGAYLLVSNLNSSIEPLKDSVKVKRFDQTSSTNLELRSLLWALNEIVSSNHGYNNTLTIYTDSQSVIGLPGRQERLEERDYYSSKNKRLNHYELYQEFYQLTSRLKCEFIKVVGHQSSSKKSNIDKLFGLVDRAARRALRKEF